jgi:hypothetical protein
LTLGCDYKGDNAAFCLGVVPDDADGTGPGMDDTELIGTQICTDMYNYESCESHGAEATWVDEVAVGVRDGADLYCPSVGYNYHCGSQVYVIEETDCPSSSGETEGSEEEEEEEVETE